jgi:hypothetical protein
MVSGATQVEIKDYTFRLSCFVIEDMRLVSLTLLRVKLRHGQLTILLTWLNLGRVFISLDVSAHEYESCTYFAVKRNCST